MKAALDSTVEKERPPWTFQSTRTASPSGSSARSFRRPSRVAVDGAKAAGKTWDAGLGPAARFRGSTCGCGGNRPGWTTSSRAQSDRQSRLSWSAVSWRSWGSPIRGLDAWRSRSISRFGRRGTVARPHKSWTMDAPLTYAPSACSPRGRAPAAGSAKVAGAAATDDGDDRFAPDASAHARKASSGSSPSGTALRNSMALDGESRRPSPPLRSQPTNAAKATRRRCVSSGSVSAPPSASWSESARYSSILPSRSEQKDVAL